MLHHNFVPSKDILFPKYSNDSSVNLSSGMVTEYAIQEIHHLQHIIEETNAELHRLEELLKQTKSNCE